ncbi:MAG: MerR family transcriptional regulator [Rhodobacteraceae bacterium]|nr:MerR family transcriptional regulator [Paracoccaceae bacterium]
MAKEHRQEALLSIGKVAELLDLKPHLIRYWESQFEELAPRRRGNRRLYSESDIELLRGLRKLLREVGMTSKGVKELLADKGVDYVAGLDRDAGDESEGSHFKLPPPLLQTKRLEALGTKSEFKMATPPAIDGHARRQLVKILDRLTAVQDRISRETAANRPEEGSS